MTEQEDRMFRRINAVRAMRGLRPLDRSWILHRYAVRHSKKQARSGRIFHGDPGAFLIGHGRMWKWWGENVGVGQTISALHDALMASPPHRANILGQFRRGTVGIYEDNQGRLWVTQVFFR